MDFIKRDEKIKSDSSAFVKGMAGFVLKNILPDNGGVTRSICKLDEQNNLTEVVETKNIIKTADGAEADGVTIEV